MGTHAAAADEIPPLDAPRFGPTIVIEATVNPDLQTIRGTLVTHGEGPGRLIDALSLLPDPSDDRTAQRTFSSVPETGWVRVRDTVVPGGPTTFYTILPRRSGASGTVPGRGLFANGLWHPQPVVGQQTAVATWEVRLHLPENTVGVLNGQVGTGTVSWSGDADRVALAVVPDARVAEIDLGDGWLTIVDAGPPRPRRDARLKSIVSKGFPGQTGTTFVLVEAPLLRRLVRPAPGMAFVSDRATRLVGKFWRYHDHAIRRGIMAAHLPQPDPWCRSLAAHLIMDGIPVEATASDDLRWVAWIPGIDALIYDGSLPFMGEVMGEVWPSDPLADDSHEVIDGATPPAVVARKIRGRYGESAAATLGRTLASGESLLDAAARADVPAEWLQRWRQHPEPQNLRVRSARRPDGQRSVEIMREAPESAPPEPIPYRVGDEVRMWQTGNGSGSMGFILPKEDGRVVVDPDAEVHQTRRDDDASPPIWSPTFSAGLSEFNVNRIRPTAGAHAMLRRRFDTRWMYGGHFATTPVDLLRFSTSITRGLGPLLDRRNRAFHVWLVPGVSWLDPDFRPTDTSGRFAVETALGGSWDTRTGGAIPRVGHRVGASTEVGWVLASDQRWTALRVGAVGLLPVAPWATLASRVGGGIAGGGVEHRMIGLGGTGAVQGLAANASMVAQGATTALDLRLMPVRHASIPLPLAWLSHVQISTGLEAGIGQRADRTHTAVGWSAGLAGVADIFGARPTLGGLWVADTLPALTSVPNTDGWPEVYLRAHQPF